MATYPADPSALVPPELLAHLHLLASLRLPIRPRLDIGDVIRTLREVPHLVRHKTKFYWTYLDAPADGTSFVTSQPSRDGRVDFALDGYIWPGLEHLVTHDVGDGLVLETYLHRSGFRHGDHVTMHTRRRFRLVPFPHTHTAVSIDPSLWLVHYCASEPSDRVSISMLPIDQHLRMNLQYRDYFRKFGDLMKKEFILGDRANWPTIFRDPNMQGVPRLGIPQHVAYPPNAHPAAEHPSKRPRYGHPGMEQGPPLPPEPVLDDEEDNWRGDFFDLVSPREIAIDRYLSNHEWMEEILSSLYTVRQIVPPDLGLGLAGELSGLTNGIFEAPVSKAPSTQPYVHRLDPKMADDFKQRVQKHIDASDAEMKRMKEAHERQLAQFSASSVYSKAERAVRTAPDWADDTHPERISVDRIVSRLEAHTGHRILTYLPIKRVQDGGYLPSAPPMPQSTSDAPSFTARALSRQPSVSSSQVSGRMIDDPDVEMGGTAGGMLDQIARRSASPATNSVLNYASPRPRLSTFPPNVPSPLSAAPISAAPISAAPISASASAPAPAHIPAPPITASTPVPVPAPTLGPGITTVSQPSRTVVQTTPDHGTGSGEWVVVPVGGRSPDLPTAQAQLSAVSASMVPTPQEPQNLRKAAAPPRSQIPPPLAGPVNPSDYRGLGNGLEEFEDTADIGMDLGIDMDGSAFGEAFQGVSERENTPADGHMSDV